VVFAGTPVFAAQALQALLAAGHEVVCVLTQPDRPAGRGMKLQASAVKQVALERGLTVLQPDRLRSGPQAAQAVEFLQDPDGKGRPDVMVVAAYGLILPASVLTIPVHGCLNIHASLLPRWRGAAPIQRAIQAGDQTTGITIMQMDAGLDTGDICRMATIEIGSSHSAALHDRLAALGAQEIVAALADLQAQRLQCQPQPAAGVTYADKIRKEEAWIDWSHSAADVCHHVAAFDPFPGACSAFSLTDGQGVVVKLFDAEALSVAADSPAATVLTMDEQGLDVACGTGRVRFRSAQKPGGKRLPVHLALQGLGLKPGAVFQNRPSD
jgi:methionyl-tRNA formyltransferase